MTPTTTSSSHLQTDGMVQHSNDVSTQPTTSYQGMAVGTSDTSSVVADDGSMKSLQQASLKDRDITDATREAEKPPLPGGLEIKPWHEQEPYKSIDALLDKHEFKIRYPLGEGNVSKVYTTNTKSNFNLIVKITHSDFLQDDPDGEFTLNLSKGEACAMELEPHSGLARNYALILKAKDKDEFFITHEPWEIPLEKREHFQVAGVICERASGQTLENATIREQEHMISIASQLADALSKLRAQNILHRDLSTKNVIMDSSGNAKIIDFDTMKSITSSGQAVSVRGTVTNMCPAILRNRLKRDYELNRQDNLEREQIKKQKRRRALSKRSELTPAQKSKIKRQRKQESKTHQVKLQPTAYSFGCDTWSLGTLMMGMLTEHYPLHYYKTAQALDKSDSEYYTAVNEVYEQQLPDKEVDIRLAHLDKIKAEMSSLKALDFAALPLDSKIALMKQHSVPAAKGINERYYHIAAKLMENDPKERMSAHEAAHALKELQL